VIEVLSDSLKGPFPEARAQPKSFGSVLAVRPLFCQEVVPLDELDSFAADMLAFSTEDVERADLVSLRNLCDFLRSLRS